MGKPTGFLEAGRKLPHKRPVQARVHDYLEIYEPFPEADLRAQASRCMDCGVPFCHQGCPLGNLIPEWNHAVYAGRDREAYERLAATNNFPEFTGRLCPAPCEAACVLAINQPAVTIKQMEVSIIDRALREGWVEPQPAAHRSGRSAVVVGSGPAGLAAAQQLARAGHAVTVLERDDRVGGLLRYGIPDFKMDKTLLDQRVAQMTAEGVVFRTNTRAGEDVTGQELLEQFDVVLLAVGAMAPRLLDVPGAHLPGVSLAMPYLTRQNRLNAGDADIDPSLDAKGKRVVILGGGDTGADCLGTALRQGAASVRQYEIQPRPPERRAPDNPWPLWPHVFRVSPAHEEGGEREYAVRTTAVEGQGRVERLVAERLDRQPPERHEDAADLVLLAMGFVGAAPSPLYAQLGVTLERGRVVTGKGGRTANPRVYAAGDAARGASLIVWAIAEGRKTAAAVCDDLAAVQGNLAAG